MREQKGAALDWRLLLQWVMATTLGYIIIWILPSDLTLLGLGVPIGALQWLVLRQHLNQVGWWVLASGLGWAMGMGWVLVGGAIPAGAGFLAGTAAGATMGIAQWIVLRNKLHQAGWWIPVSILGWTLAVLGFLGLSLDGAMAGIVTGIALELLLRYPGLLKAED